MTISGAGGERKDVVIDRRYDTGIDDRLGRAEIQKGLLGLVTGEAELIGAALHADLVGRKDLVLMAAIVICDIDIWVIGPVALALVLTERTEHGTVVHAVSIDDRIKVAEITAIPAFHENSTHGVPGLFPGVVQVVAVVAALDDWVRDVGAGNQDPTQHIAVDLPQGGKVHIPQSIGVGIHVDRRFFLRLFRAAAPIRCLREREGWKIRKVWEIDQVSGFRIGFISLLVLKELVKNAGRAPKKDQEENNNDRRTYLLFHKTPPQKQNITILTRLY